MSGQRLRVGLLCTCLAFVPARSSAQDDLTTQSTVQVSRASEEHDGFRWGHALVQSGFLLAIQHSLRMAQEKTRDHLGGPFWHDYLEAVSGLHGWDDGNPWTTNYLGHPVMGATTAFIQIQNDPGGRTLEWAPHSRRYWVSRLKGLAWSAGYSTMYELSPIGEAGIGNVGADPGTMAWVDLVITPLAGFGLVLLEDWIDARYIKKIEQGKSSGTARIFRVLMNPDRGLANLMRLKRPSHRDTRPPP